MYQRMGPKRFISEVVFAGINKRIKSRYGRIRHGYRYGQKCLFVAGLPKSGSTWVSDLLRSLPGFYQFTPIGWNQAYQVGEIGATEHALYPGWDKEFRGMLAVVKGHTWGTEENVAALKRVGCRYVLTMRDPRDVIISEYWFVRRTPHHASYALASRLELGEYITHKLEDGSFNAMTLDWIRCWLGNLDKGNSLLIKYEDLLADTTARFEEIIGFLGLNLSEDEIRRTVERNTFECKAQRAKGVEDTSQFLRKGTSGQWRDVFTSQHLKCFSDIGEDVIRELGYEPTLESGL